MLKSIRTKIMYQRSTYPGTFNDFVEHTGVDINVGSYYSDPPVINRYICILFSTTNSETTSTITHMALKYGSIDNAYATYMDCRTKKEHFIL